MSHLSREELARLVDEAPTDPEASHLRDCRRCRDELEALRTQGMELRQLERPRAPDPEWARLETRLRAEGVLRPEVRAVPSHSSGWLGWGRVAAAIAIFLAGGATGAVAVTAMSPPATPESVAPTGSVAVAAERVRTTERDYMNAIEAYSQIAEPTGAPDPVNRLAALEGILITTRSALREAPDDPIINNYHLTALGLRDALVRQMEQLDSGEEWF